MLSSEYVVVCVDRESCLPVCVRVCVCVADGSKNDTVHLWEVGGGEQLSKLLEVRG